MSSIATEVNPYEGYFHAIMARFDQLEHKLEILIDRVIDEVNNGNKPKDLLLNEFFSAFCTLKAWDKGHPSAIVCKWSLGLFLKFMGKKHPSVKSLRELTPRMISEYVRHLKDKRIFSKRRNQWESLSERIINEHIKKLRHALEIVDSRGTQGLRERLITIKGREQRRKSTSHLMRSWRARWVERPIRLSSRLFVTFCFPSDAPNSIFTVFINIYYINIMYL